MCQILYYFQEQYNDDTREEISDFLFTHEMGLSLSIASHLGWFSELADEGKAWVEATFSDFLELFGLEDTGYDDFFVIEAMLGLEPEKD